MTVAQELPATQALNAARQQRYSAGTNSRAWAICASYRESRPWIEPTEYVERNTYSDFRIVAWDDGRQGLNVSAQATSRHGAAGLGWEDAERIGKTLGEACDTRVLVPGHP